jgi:hypothetical protein
MSSVPAAATGGASAAPAPSSWRWPIDVTRYDRTPTLAPAEHAALEVLGWELRRRRCHDARRPE